MIPTDWLPAAKMDRVIVHWTAGKYTPNKVDLEHYHILISGYGTPIKGKHSIKANAAPRSRSYAAHTLGTNTGSIGISLCAMEGAKEVPFNAGKYPFTKVQWDTLVKALAQLCRHYRIPVTLKTVLTHAEVERNLGIKQRNKWDITRIPYDVNSWGARTVGNMLRADVEMALNVVDGVLNPETAPFIPPDNVDRPAWAYNLFRNMGWSHEASVALVGRAQQEIFHDLRFYDPKTKKPIKGDPHLPGGSVGMFQWNNGSKGQYNRRTNFEKFVKSIGKGWDDFEANVRFADFELRTTERTAGDALRAAKTIYSACRAVMGYTRSHGWSALYPQGGHGWKNTLNNAIELDRRLKHG